MCSQARETVDHKNALSQQTQASAAVGKTHLRLDMGMPREGVFSVDRCELSVADAVWPFAERHKGEIETHWSRRRAENNTFFNGAIHLLQSQSLHDDTFAARFLRTDFKSYLYWRETGMTDKGVADGFGSALIRSAEGHQLLGQQREGLNAGLAYPPGAYIDERDVAANGAIDIEASIGREMQEEMGLSRDEVDRVPGFILTFAPPLVSIAVELKSKLGAASLRARILDHIAQQADPELADIVVVRSVRDLAELRMPTYARILLAELLKGQ
jgi:hypothetical protein